MDNYEPITVLYKEPYKDAEVVTIPNALEHFQRMVGGYIQVLTIANWYGAARQVVMICDEEAKLKQPKPEPNLLLRSLIRRPDIVRGAIVICAATDEDFAGLTEDEVQVAKTWLKMVQITKGGCNDD